jgi:hypothetical protein
VGDPVSRSAAKLATLIAVPVALLAGIGVFALLNGLFSEPAGPPGPAPPSAGAPTPAATGQVATDARALDDRAELACRDLLARLPAEVADLAQRPVTEGPDQNAAYGDPPVRLACGVPPAEHPDTATMWGLSGVCWYADERADATVWTTVDRDVPVRVTVPAVYEGASQQVIGFSPAIAGSIRSADTVPSGCAS